MENKDGIKDIKDIENKILTQDIRIRELFDYTRRYNNIQNSQVNRANIMSAAALGVAAATLILLVLMLAGAIGR